MVLTLYRIFIYIFQMCNRLPEVMKNGDPGIFPVYYGLNPFGTIGLTTAILFFLTVPCAARATLHGPATMISHFTVHCYTSQVVYAYFVIHRRC